MKLLGNSGYGKTATNIDRHRDVKYYTEIGTSALINNKRFRQLDVVTEDAYEIEMNKSVVEYTLPLHIGFFVYQYAKLRMLQFYYDFVDRYVERPLFQYCEMDTDSAYIALAGESIDGLVRADRRAHYFRHRSQWLPAECCDEHEDDYIRARIAGRSWTATESCCFARNAFDKRTPGLFKVEWCGEGFIGLCSKTYYCFGVTDKYSTKGLSKRHNDVDKDTFLTVLTNRQSGGGFNRGFFNLKIISTDKDSEGRRLFILIKINNVTIRLANIYAPVIPSERRLFFNSLHHYLLGNCPVILGGDFNCVQNINLDKRGGGGNEMYGNFGSKQLISLCDDNNLIDVFRKLHPAKREYTWTNSLHSMFCRVDRFYITEPLLRDVLSFQHHPINYNFSDHGMIHIDTTIAENVSYEVGPGYWKCNTNILKDPFFQEDFKML